MAKSIFEQIVDRSIETLSASDLEGLTVIEYAAFYSCTSLKSVEIPNTVERIGSLSFSGCAGVSDITIPSRVNNIESLAFQTWTSLKNVRFEQPAGMEITLPSAGASGGMFYIKSAYAINVYTDNETIKNYNWSADNRTATLYHLDGTLWE